MCLTLGWTAALLIGSAGACYLGANFAARDYLIVSPLWAFISDTALVSCSILYGRAKLVAQPAKTWAEALRMVML